MWQRIAATKLCIILATFLLLCSCVLTDRESVQDQSVGNMSMLPQQYSEVADSDNVSEDLIGVLLRSLYYTREDALQFQPFQYWRYDTNDGNVVDKGVLDHQRFFYLYHIEFLHEELEQIQSGTVSAYQVICEGNHDKVDAVIVQSESSVFQIVEFHHEAGYFYANGFGGNDDMEEEGIYSASVPTLVDSPIPFTTLEEFLRSFHLEEQLRQSNLDLGSTNVLVFCRMHPFDSALSFLFSDGENEYIFSTEATAYNPYDFLLSEYLLPEEVNYFTMEAGELYNFKEEILPLIIEQYEVGERLQDRESRSE